MLYGASLKLKFKSQQPKNYALIQKIIWFQNKKKIRRRYIHKYLIKIIIQFAFLIPFHFGITRTTGTSDIKALIHQIFNSRFNPQIM